MNNKKQIFNLQNAFKSRFRLLLLPLKQRSCKYANAIDLRLVNGKVRKAKLGLVRELMRAYNGMQGAKD